MPFNRYEPAAFPFRNKKQEQVMRLFSRPENHKVQTYENGGTDRDRTWRLSTILR
jgi:hypothetical protein